MTDAEKKLYLKRVREKFFFVLCGLFMLLTIAVLSWILFDVISKGYSTINWTFLTDRPREQMTAGGIWPAIVGTFYVASLTIIISVPLGITSAIYLNEYASKGTLVRIIRLSIRNLSGVPSIVYGLFGLGLFAATLGLGTSLITAALTLSIMSLPWVITASEEALKAVPQSFREGGLALGATKWQTIRQLVLPNAIPGMATGSILALARAAGETAPIILTGAAFFLPALPSSLGDRFMAMPYHLYILATQHMSPAQVRPIAYATALVLIALVMALNLAAIVWRYRIRKRQIW